MELDFDRVAQDFMMLCGSDSTCSGKLGPDPWARVVDLTLALAGGHCPELSATWGLNGSSLRLVLASLMLGPTTRAYVPAVVYRYGRCAGADVAAIGQLLTVLFGGSQETSPYDALESAGLRYNVALSELWPDVDLHPTVEDVAAEQSTCTSSVAQISGRTRRRALHPPQRRVVWIASCLGRAASFVPAASG